MFSGRAIFDLDVDHFLMIILIVENYIVRVHVSHIVSAESLLQIYGLHIAAQFLIGGSTLQFR